MNSERKITLHFNALSTRRHPKGSRVDGRFHRNLHVLVPREGLHNTVSCFVSLCSVKVVVVY